MMWEELYPPYSTIVADPPWQYAEAGVTQVDARKFYSTMDLCEIMSLPVAELADQSAHLWLWSLSGMIEEAHQVVRAWGFRPITMVTWCKTQPGVGHYIRGNTEHAIFATRGKPMVPDIASNSTWFVASRSAHSVKPAAFLDIVEQVSPGPYVELFCRQPRFGWDTWGRGFENFEAVRA